METCVGASCRKNGSVILGDIILGLLAGHGEGIGIGLAEAPPKESAHAVAPKTDAANKTDAKFFMRKSLIPETEFRSDREL